MKGTVRNCTIKKIFVKISKKNDLKVNTGFENVSVNIYKIDQKLLHVEDPNKSVLNDSVNAIQCDLKTKKEITCISNKHSKPTKKLLLKCSSCDLQKLSLLAQLQHKKYGHIEFWSRSFSCKICGFRCADKGNLAKHFKWKHNEIKTEQQGTKQVEVHENAVDTVIKTNQLANYHFASENKQLTVKKQRQRIVAIAECSGCNINSLPRRAQHQHNKLGHDAFWDRPLSCSCCEMRFCKKAALGVHKSIHNTTLTCTNCNSFVTFKLKYLVEHKETCLKSDMVTTTNPSIQYSENGTGNRSADD